MFGFPNVFYSRKDVTAGDLFNEMDKQDDLLYWGSLIVGDSLKRIIVVREGGGGGRRSVTPAGALGMLSLSIGSER